ncbi:hypothetical protein VYU27_006564 [Nannochloropsis oceanica]
MVHVISKDHSRLVKCLYRQLLRDARRVKHSRAPFLFLQERPSRERYSHLWEVTPDHDARLLDAFLPSYLRHELTTCELKSHEMERIVKANFRRFRNLGVAGASASNSGGSGSSREFATLSPSNTSSSSSSSGSSRRGSRNRSGGASSAASASPPPTLDEVIDDCMTLTRLMSEQLRLFECTSVTDSFGVRVIATATAAVDEQQRQEQQQQHHQSSSSTPQSPPHFFFYNIRVENRNRKATVQLVGRHWVIQDNEGKESDSVPKGSIGVVGHEPVLRPGQTIVYMSGAKLPTPYGSMQGSFQMVKKMGEGNSVPDKFDARVSPFVLK